jgi:hypothetical protein
MGKKALDKTYQKRYDEIKNIFSQAHARVELKS